MILFNYIYNKNYLLKDIISFDDANLKKEKNKKIHEKNLIEKKLSPNYIGKLSLLLYDSTNYKDYPIKRKNLNKTIFKDIGGNKMRLTFKKFPIKLDKTNNSNNNYSRNLTKICPKKLNLSGDLSEIKEKRINLSNNNFHNTLIISDDIKEILYNNEEKNSLEEQKTIYDKLKNKFSYYKPKFMSKLNPQFFETKIKCDPKNLNLKNISLSNSLLKKYQPEIQTSSDIDINNLLKTCNSLKTLRDKKKLNIDLLNNKQQLYEKIKEELFIFNEKKIIRKRVFMSNVDFFYYNAKKWNKLSEKNKANKEREELNNLFSSVNKAFNKSIKNFKNKSNYYSNKLLKLSDIFNKRKVSVDEINKGFDIE